MRVSEWRGRLGRALGPVRADLQRTYEINEITLIDTNSWNAVLVGRRAETTSCVKLFNETTSALAWPEDELDLIGRSLTRLELGGFRAVVPPLTTLDGKFCVRCGGYLAMVFPWIAGLASNAWPRTPTARERAAIVLSDLHAAGRDAITGSAGLRCRSFPPAASSATWGRNLEAIWDRARSNLSVRGASSSVLASINAARREAEDMIARNAGFFSPHEEDVTLLHGDYTPENVAFPGTSREIVFDFDLAYAGRPEEDVAYASLAFSGPRWLMGRRDWDRCRHFVEAYASRQAAGRRALRPDYLATAFEWVVLKWLSLAFKPEQVAGRLQLLEDVRRHAPEVSGWLR